MKAFEPDWAYIRLEVTPAAPDAITWRLTINQLLQRFAGIHGAALQTDLVVWSPKNAVLRCPYPNLSVVMGALNGEANGTDIKVVGSSPFLMNICPL